MKSLLHSTLTIFYLFSLYVIAQSEGNFRSADPGNWKDVVTLKRYNGGPLNGETN